MVDKVEVRFDPVSDAIAEAVIAIVAAVGSRSVFTGYREFCTAQERCVCTRAY